MSATYWRQIVLGLSLAAITFFYFTRQGYPPIYSVAAGILTYFAVRWFVTWIFRIRYWYRRGTRGIYTRSCANCGQYIYRKSGDWIIKCHVCGWIAGFPVLRWFTKSVPAIQLRRTIDVPRLVIVLVAAAILILGAPAFPQMADSGVDASTSPNDNIETTDDNGVQTTDDNGGGQSSPTPAQSESENRLDRSRVERLIYSYINEERSKRGLSQLDFDGHLREVARYHSRDMGVNNYYSHVSPDGEDFSDRYDKFGYSCRVPTTGNKYLTGGENIAYTQREGFSYGGDEALVANIFVENWMDSEGHRENILNEHWENHAVGIYIVEGVDSKTIYATQNFC